METKSVLDVAQEKFPGAEAWLGREHPLGYRVLDAFGEGYTPLQDLCKVGEVLSITDFGMMYTAFTADGRLLYQFQDGVITFDATWPANVRAQKTVEAVRRKLEGATE